MIRRLLQRSVVRYFLVGGISAGVDFVFFTLFAYVLGYPYLVIGALGATLATMVNYLLSVRFVFSSGVRFSRHAEIAAVYAVSAIGIGVNQLALYVLVDGLMVHLLASKILATSVTFAWNYSARRFYVFAPARERVDQGAEA